MTVYKVEVAHKIYKVSAFSSKAAIVLGQAEAIKDALADWENAKIVD